MKRMWMVWGEGGCLYSVSMSDAAQTTGQVTGQVAGQVMEPGNVHP